MSVLWTARDLAILGFPPSGQNSGRMLLLQCYFDDSGTHDASEFVVWGGVLGGVEQIVDLDAKWLRLLSEPLPGKPAIKNFHLSHCVMGLGDFEAYNHAERDRVIPTAPRFDSRGFPRAA